MQVKTLLLTAKNRDQGRNPTLGTQVWAGFTLFTACWLWLRAVRIASYSRLHPIIPRIYTQPWMHDMNSRTLLLEVAHVHDQQHYFNYFYRATIWLLSVCLSLSLCKGKGKCKRSIAVRKVATPPRELTCNMDSWVQTVLPATRQR